MINISSPFSRASTAAFILSKASSRPTTSFPGVWPHLFGASWSSIKTPAQPALASPDTVRMTFIAFPYPVSPSAINGIEVASVMFLA